MKRFSLILLLLFWVLQMQAITVIVKVTHNGQPLKEYLPDVTGNENGFSNYMRFRVWLNGTEEDAMTDGDDGLSELWELEANGDMYLSFDTDMLTMKPAGKTLWVEVTESKTGLTWKEKFLLPNHTVEDAVLDLIGVYDPKPTIKINQPLAVCFPTTVNLEDPAITAGSDNLTFNYFTDRGCTSGLGNTTISAVGKNTYYIYGVNTAGVSSDTAEINVTINPTPTITLTATNGAGGNVVDGETMCKGAGLSLSVIGVDVGNGGTYAWSIVGGGTDDNFKQETGILTAQNGLNPSTDIKYQVIGKNQEGCSDTKSLTLQVNEVPVVDLRPKGIDAVVCAGVDLPMTAGATASDGENIIEYVWSTGGNASTATFNSTTAGTEKVFVTVTQSNGCKKADTTTVTVKPVPTEVKITPATAICENDQNVQFTASAKELDATFAWTVPAAQGGKNYIYTPTAGDIVAGSVEFKVTANLNGCSAEADQTITINQKPTLTKPTVTGNKDVCYNSEVQLNFTETAGNTYVWTVGGNVQSITGNDPTVKIANTGNFAYVVKVTNDATHCSDTASVQLTGHRVIVGNLTQTPGANVDPDTQVDLNAPGVQFIPVQTEGKTYEWKPGDKIATGVNAIAAKTTKLASTTQFTFIASDQYNCVDSSTIKVVVKDMEPLEIKDLTFKEAYCKGEEITISAKYSGGSGEKVVEWTCDDNTVVLRPTTSGTTTKVEIATAALTPDKTYQIVLTVTNGARVARDTAEFRLNDVPTITMEGPKFVCAFTQVALNPTANAGAGSDLTGATYAWVNFTNRDKSSITAGVLAEATAIPGADLNKYVLTVTDANGCKAVDTARVTGRQVVVDVTPADKSIAYGVSETLGATVSYIPADNTQGNVTYAWTPADSVADATDVPTNTVHLRGTTKFKLMVTAEDWACSGTDSVTLTVTGNALIAAPKTDKNVYCANDTVKLLPVVSGGSGKYEFAWSGDVTSTDSVPVINGLAADTYTVNLVVKDKETGYKLDPIPVTFTVKQLPTITMPGRPANVCKEGEMTLTATVNSDNGLTTAVYAWTAVRGTILNSTDAVADVKASGQAGEDQFILKVTDDAGCMLSDTTKVKVHAITLPKVNIPAVACGKTAQLDITQEATCLGVETMTYTWGPAELFGGTQVTGENVTTENIEGNTAFFIEVKESGYDCVDTLTGNISPQGCDFTITTDDVAVCEGGSVQLQVNSSMQTGVTYNWVALDAGTIDANGIVNASGLTAGQSYDFEVTAIYTVSADLEVERKDTATVTVWEKPTVTLTQSGGTCVNEIVTFTAEVEKGTIPYIKYVWKGAEQIDGTPDQATLALTGTAQNVSVTVTDKNGCTGTDNKIGIKGDRIVVSLSAEPGHQIAGSTTTLTATVTTGTAASLEFRRIKPDWVQLASPSLATTATDNPVKVSTYQVLAVTAGGCKDSSDYIVNVVDNELIVNGTNLLLCEEQSLDDAYLTARAYGGVVLETNKGYEFTWVAPAGVKLADAATSTNFGEGSKIKLVQMPAAGDYTITVTVKDKNGKSKSTSLLLRVKAKPEIKINGETEGDMMACVGTEPFKLTATGPAGMKFEWQTPADLKDNTGATQEISVATAGTYTVKVQGRLDGCTTTLSRDLVVNPAPVLAINRTDAAAGWEGCAGTTLELKAAVTAGAKPYTYVWTGATKVAGGKDSLATLTLAAGSNAVTVTVTDGNSCSVSKQQALTGNTIDVKLTGTPAGQIIAGQSVKLKATVSLGTADTYTYTEVGKAIVLGTKDTLTVKPAASTTYQVVVVSDKECKDTASYNVNVGSTTPVITVTNVAICQGTADVDVTATTAGGKANYNYTWSSTNPAITITPATDNNKEGASTVKLTNLAALAAGTYSINVNVKDADNVSAIQKTLTLTVNARPVVKINGKQASDTTFCVGATGARLMASGATNYTWLTPAGVAGNHDATLAVATASEMTDVEYQVVGKSAAGCVDTTTIQVTVQALPEVKITGEKEVCAGTETTLTANVTGTGNYTYSWDGATATADGTYTVKPVKGDNQITLTVKDANGCEVNATHGINGMGMTIQLIANPLKQNYDKDEQIQLQALIQDGGKATNYRFVNTSDPVVVIYNGPQDTVSVRPDNIYIYRVYVTSEDHGCIDSASIKINVKDMPLSIEAEGQAVCQATPDGDLVKFTAEASGGMGDYKYTWGVDPNESPDAIAKITFGNQQETVNKGSEITLTSIKDLPAGKYKIKVTVRDTNILGGPITKDTFTYLTINPLPDVKIKVGDKLLGADTLFCLNTPNVTLTASDSATTTNKWAWTVPAGVTASTTKEQAVNTATVTTAPVKYKVQITNKFNCVDTAMVNVTIAPLPTVTIEGPAVACVGTNIALKAVAKNGKLPYSYDWEGILDGGQTAIIGDSIADIGDDGYFTEVYVRVTDKNGCESAQQIHNLEWTTGPDIEKLIVTDSCSKATLVLRGKNLTGAGYTWTLTPSTATGVSGGNDTTYIVTSPSGRYTVEVVAESANKVCTDTGRISGNIMDVQLAVAFKSERDTCGALKMPLTLTKTGTTTVQDVQVKYSYQAFGQTDRVERDTVFKTTALATAAIATPDPGIYRLISVTDTTYGCSASVVADDMDSVRVGFQPKAVITPQNNMGFHNVDSKDVDYVLHVKNPDNTKATYVWTSDPADKMTTYPGTTDSIHYNLAAAGVDTVKYFLTATGKGDVVCISRDTVSVQVGVLDLPAPVIAIDTNTNRLDIKIHWEPVAGATGYKVYNRKWDPYGLVTADNGGNYTSQTVTGTEFTRSAADVATDTLAFYYVTAVNAGGTESVPSDTVGYKVDELQINTPESRKTNNNIISWVFDMRLNGISTSADYFRIIKKYIISFRAWDVPTQGWAFATTPNDFWEDDPENEEEFSDVFDLNVGGIYQLTVETPTDFLQYGYLPPKLEYRIVAGNPGKVDNNVVALPFHKANLKTSAEVFLDISKNKFLAVRKWDVRGQGWVFATTPNDFWEDDPENEEEFNDVFRVYPGLPLNIGFIKEFISTEWK